MLTLTIIINVSFTNLKGKNSTPLFAFLLLLATINLKHFSIYWLNFLLWIVYSGPLLIYEWILM